MSSLTSFTVKQQGVKLITFPAITGRTFFQHYIRSALEIGFFRHRDNQARRLVLLHRDTETETGRDQPTTGGSSIGGYGAGLSASL